MLDDVPGVEGDEEAEDEQRDDLPDDTRDHHVVARVEQGGIVLAGGGDAASGPLHDEREQVTEDEDPGVEARAEDAVLRPQFNDDVLQRQIDAGGDEGRGDDEAADLGLEAVAGPGVGVHHDAADVADGLGQGAESEGDAEGPCLVADTLNEVDEAADGEDGAKKGVGGEGWGIAVDGLVDGTVRRDVCAVDGGEVRGRENTAVGGIGLRTLWHFGGWCYKQKKGGDVAVLEG